MPIFRYAEEGVFPENALVALGNSSLPGLAVIHRKSSPLSPFLLPSADYNNLPHQQVAKGQHQEAQVVMQKFNGRAHDLAQALQLDESQFVKGDSYVYPSLDDPSLEAHQIYTPKVQSVQFDPLCWRVNLDGFEGINKAAASSSTLLIRAETFQTLYTALTKDEFMKKALQLLPREYAHRSEKEVLARYNFLTDPRRVRLGALALELQLTAGRMGLLMMLIRNRSSGLVIALANCVNAFTDGQIERHGVLDRNTRHSVEQRIRTAFKHGKEESYFKELQQEYDEMTQFLNQNGVTI